MVNVKWEQQKEYVRTKPSEEKQVPFTVNVRLMWKQFLDSQRLILGFTRFSVHGKSKVENEIVLH